MTAVAVLRLPLAVDLSGFVKLLQRMQVPHRVSEEAGEQVLWVPANISEDVRSLYERFPAGDPDQQLDIPITQTRQRPGFVEQLRHSKATALVLLLTLIVAMVTLLGENLETIRWLTFLDFRVVGEYIHFTPLVDSLAAGQWWRLVTPMLIHFGILHLAMNGMWYWELGRRIESRQGSINLIGLTLLFSLVSNYTQYLFQRPEPVWRVVRGAVRPARALLDLSDPVAEPGVSPASRGVGDDAGVVAGVSVGAGLDDRLRPDCQRGPRQRVTHRMLHRFVGRFVQPP